MAAYTWDLQPGTSLVDWCEENYTVLPFIAEYGNTVSSFGFVLFPVLFCYLSKDYTKHVNGYAYFAWGLLAFTGVFSAYFHATLSQVGQLLDELSIVWTACVAYAIWLPKRQFPRWLKKDRRKLSKILLVVSVLVIPVSSFYPVLNAFVLMILTVPTIRVLSVEARQYRNTRVARIIHVNLAFIILSVTCWLFDRFFCELWLSLQWTYLHGVWHVCIAYAVCLCFVSLSYVHVTHEQPEWAPRIKFWPSDRLEFGIPYLILAKKL